LLILKNDKQKLENKKLKLENKALKEENNILNKLAEENILENLDLTNLDSQLRRFISEASSDIGKKSLSYSLIQFVKNILRSKKYYPKNILKQ
jgi:hypothetical protein